MVPPPQKKNVLFGNLEMATLVWLDWVRPGIFLELWWSYDFSFKFLILTSVGGRLLAAGWSVIVAWGAHFGGWHICSSTEVCIKIGITLKIPYIFFTSLTHLTEIVYSQLQEARWTWPHPAANDVLQVIYGAVWWLH